MTDRKDPVAEKSKFLCIYMSNHPDTLVAYVRYFGQIKEVVSSAQMLAIDTTGMTLQYEVNKTGVKKEVRVAFDPPLLGYEEVKPRLIAMTADAQESLGMIKTPQVTTMSYPTSAIFVGLSIVFLSYLTASPYYVSTRSPYRPYFTFGYYVYGLLGGSLVNKLIWGGILSSHTFEALYVGYLSWKHTPFSVGLQYTLGTVFVGAPFMSEIRKRIQQARIDSIMKGN